MEHTPSAFLLGLFSDYLIFFLIENVKIRVNFGAVFSLEGVIFLINTPTLIPGVLV